MKVLVCIKQVPGSNNVGVDPVTGVLIRDGVESKLNPYDLYALELAFNIAAKYGGEVEVITMGPPQAKDAVLEAIYMGAASGCLVTDRKFAGADVLATSYTLSQAIKISGSYDIIICGKQTTDGDTAQVGAELSEFLELPFAGNVISVEDILDDRVIVKVSMEHFFVTQSMPMPCLICAESDINTPRLPSYKRMKELGESKVKTMTLDDFQDTDANHYGLNGSPTRVERIFPPERNTDKKVFMDNSGDKLAEQLQSLLSGNKFI